MTTRDCFDRLDASQLRTIMYDNVLEFLLSSQNNENGALAVFSLNLIVIVLANFFLCCCSGVCVCVLARPRSREVRPLCLLMCSIGRL